MKQVIAYVSDYETALYKKKSDALSMDAQKIAAQIAAKIITNDSDAHQRLTKSLIKLADQDVSPRRLMRLYGKLWRAKKAYQLACEEESQREEISF